MKIINGEKHYTAKEIGMLVKRTHLTIHLWDTWSNLLEERGDKRLIPKPIKIGKQKTRYWNEKEVPSIKHFADNIQRGDLAEFSQKQWVKKDKTRKKGNISEKKMLKSIESKKELLVEDKLIYALIFLLQKNEKNVSITTLEEYFTFDRDVIYQSLQTLIDLSLIIKKDENYVLI